MDLIAAIATGAAASAIGVVRLSGDGCSAACGRVFRPANGRPFGDQEPRKLVMGEMLDSRGRVIDRGMAVRFPAPRSYTGEDAAELHCHGSPVVLRELLSALFAAGARQAVAGEFTRRAFLNGRMDLTQAEAVIDLIDAETAAAARNAAAQLDGGLRRVLEPVQETLLDVASRFYAVVDYPDEDIQDVNPAEVSAALASAEEALTRLLADCRRGQVLKHGVRTAIVGLPNAGKSSLLNALAGYDRAIVTDIPGTTRDTVEERCELGGVPLRLIDTAGLRDTDDPVEKLGVERSRKAMEEAGLILVLIDASRPAGDEDFALLHEAVALAPTILVWTKGDLPAVPCPVKRYEEIGCPAVTVSAKVRDLDELCNEISCAFPQDLWGGYGEILTNARQEEAASRALEAVRRAREALTAGVTPDALLTDVEEALEALGELTGQSVREDITDRIFAKFCVGK